MDQFFGARSCGRAVYAEMLGSVFGSVCATNNTSYGFHAHDGGRLFLSDHPDFCCSAFNGWMNVLASYGSFIKIPFNFESCFSKSCGIASMYGSTIEADGFVVHDNESIGAYCNYSSTLRCWNSRSYDNTKSGYECGTAGNIEAVGAVAYRNEQGFYCMTGGVMEAPNAQSYDNYGMGFSSADGATIRCKGAKAYGNQGTGFSALYGAGIRGDSIEAFNNQERGIAAGGNSWIHAPGGTANGNASDDVYAAHYSNVLTADGRFPTYFMEGLGHLQPATNNLQYLGRPHLLWAGLYAGTATINTSDRRYKEGIAEIPLSVLEAWGTVDILQFKFIKENTEKNGNARNHIGPIAQDIEEKFAAAGENASLYGLFCIDVWPEKPAKYEEIEYQISPEVFDDDGNIVAEAVYGTKQVLIEKGHEAGDKYSIRPSECLFMEATLLRWILGQLTRKREEETWQEALTRTMDEQSMLAAKVAELEQLVKGGMPEGEGKK